MTFPKPRIPRLLGAAEVLSEGNSVYPTINLDVPITPIVLAISAGALTAAIPVDFNMISGWATRFQSLFREYVILGAKLEIRPNNMTVTSGATLLYWDEASSSAPSLAEALNRPRLDMLNAPLFDRTPYYTSWVPRDIEDYDYLPTGSAFSPVSIKVYTDASLGTNGSTTGQFIITGTLALQFRGYI